MIRPHVFLILILLGAPDLMAQTPWPYTTLDGNPPLIIAHRGASGYLPEHTLEAYRLAIDLGADYIEPDLLLTRDGVLVARHDNYLSTSTDIAARDDFADRKRTKTIDGQAREDWFVEDFTLAELKTLRARQAFPGRSTAHDGRYQIPTFAEILKLVAEQEAAAGRPIGIYPETKHPQYFAEQGLDFVEPLLDALAAAGRDRADAGVFIQSFEAEILQQLKSRTPVRLIMLVYGDPATGAVSFALEDAADFAHGVGPSKALLFDPDGRPSDFVGRAHALGLAVHPWTYRVDQRPDRYPSSRAELDDLWALGIDGLFTDFPDVARAGLIPAPQPVR